MLQNGASGKHGRGLRRDGGRREEGICACGKEGAVVAEEFAYKNAAIYFELLQLTSAFPFISDLSLPF